MSPEAARCKPPPGPAAEPFLALLLTHLLLRRLGAVLEHGRRGGSLAARGRQDPVMPGSSSGATASWESFVI